MKNKVLAAANVKDLRGFLVTFPYFSSAIDYKGIS